MNSILWGVLSGACIFGGAAFGHYLGRFLPKDHLTSDARDAMKVASGMIATLVALVLGLMVASAKNTFDTINTQSVQIGSKILYMDHLLSKYGPDAKPIRDQMHDSLAAGIKRIWPDEDNGMTGAQALQVGTGGMEKAQEMVEALTPATDAQRKIQAQADQLFTDMQMSRWLAIEQLQSALPTNFFLVLLCWLTLLYTCMGIYAPRNTTVLVAFGMSTLCFSTAIFLIVELSRPLDGLMKISSAPLRNVLAHMDK